MTTTVTPRASVPLPALRPWFERAGRPLGRVFGRDWGRALVWVASFVPAVYLAWQLWLAFQGQPHDLGREPVKGMEHATGEPDRSQRCSGDLSTTKSVP